MHASKGLKDILAFCTDRKLLVMTHGRILQSYCGMGCLLLTIYALKPLSKNTIV
jgi:hypothetical protein